jgi:hypothetical protein
MSRQEVIIQTLGLPRTSQTISLRPSHAGTLLETPYRCPPNCKTFTGLLFRQHVPSRVAAWICASRDASFFDRPRDNSNCVPSTQFGSFPNLAMSRFPVRVERGSCFLTEDRLSRRLRADIAASARPGHVRFQPTANATLVHEVSQVSAERIHFCVVESRRCRASDKIKFKTCE